MGLKIFILGSANDINAIWYQLSSEISAEGKSAPGTILEVKGWSDQFMHYEFFIKYSGHFSILRKHFRLNFNQKHHKITQLTFYVSIINPQHYCVQCLYS